MRRIVTALACVLVLSLTAGCTKQAWIKGGEKWRDSICREETRDRGPCPRDEDESRWRRL